MCLCLVRRHIHMLGPHFDVAVVGAGPAGSTAGRVTAGNGLKTVVFERRASVGVPVQCGEFLPAPREMTDLFPKSPRGTRLVRVPERFVTNTCSRICLVSPRCSQFEFSFKGQVLNRAEYDRWLAKEAEMSGAEIRLRSTVVGMTGPNEIVVNDKMGTHRITADVIVGADGPRSRIGHSLGARYMTKPEDLSISMQYVMTGVKCDPDVVEMYFGGMVAPGGYAWIIPKGGSTANVGLGLRRAFASADVPLREYLNRFVRDHPLARLRTRDAKAVSSVGALIPMGGPLQRTWSDTTVLVGDAAGHVMASNGGGIPTALIGGDIAGEAITRHAAGESPLSWYEDTWKKEMGNELATALTTLHIADHIMPSDNLTDLCMRMAGVRYLEPLIRCRLPLPVSLAVNSFVRVLEHLL